jgi:hypothetical protein
MGLRSCVAPGWLTVAGLVAVIVVRLLAGTPGVDIDVRADGYGNVNTQLNLLCINPYGVTNPSVGIDATNVTPSIADSMPGSCGQG